MKITLDRIIVALAAICFAFGFLLLVSTMPGCERLYDRYVHHPVHTRLRIFHFSP